MIRTRGPPARAARVVVRDYIVASHKQWVDEKEQTFGSANGMSANGQKRTLRRSATDRCAAQNPLPCQFNVAYVKF